ncbi:NUDIX domain-containing protein [uncultured Nocardioides sp.]|uniref:NUDIX hydrolase n=1 Tax=uncultured Nocardioides sp. TaxID=198441 RepID=UPI0026154044|nr:NUDIX domain-containing protein [uncultured Nocardioides sp.]
MSTGRRPPLPQKLVEQAAAFASGEATPAEPRNAATVVLLRPAAAGGSEVYLLRRQTSMAFAGGMCVFPGGGVDPRDFEGDLRWAGPSPQEWATHLGVEVPLARALVCAAVRETFEESGVLLAGEGHDSVVADTSGDDWEADRVALEGREVSLTELFGRRGLVMRTDLLGTWSAWCTPEFEPRRYRTWFFAARLPDGQRTRDVSTESSEVMWVPTAEALRMADEGEVGMMPPTWFNVLDADAYDGPDAVLAGSRDRTVEMFMPQAVQVDGEWRLSSPPGFEDLLAARGVEA